MSDERDIVDRLREPPKTYQGGQVGACTMLPSSWLLEAADEIERLRAENEAMRAEAKRIIEAASRELERVRDGEGHVWIANERMAQRRGAESILAAGRKAVEG